MTQETPSMLEVIRPPDYPAAPPLRKRRRWPWILLAVFLGFVTLVIGALLYAQSEDAFQRFMLPIAAAQLGGKLEVEKGSVSLAGKLSLEGIRFADDQDLEIFAAESVFVNVAPFSFIRGTRPHVREVTIESPHFVSRTGAGVESAKDSAKSKKDSDSEKESETSSETAFIPAAIDRVRIHNLSGQWVKDDVTQIDLSTADIEVDSLAPGQEGQIKINYDFVIAPEEKSRTHSGTMAFNLDLKQNESGTQMEYKGTSLLAVQEGPPKPSGGVKLGLKLDLQQLVGSVDRSGVIRSKVMAEASSDNKQAGTFKLDLDADSSKKKILTHADLIGVNKELLNPVLAALGKARFEDARIDGSLSIEAVGEAYQFNSSFEAKGLSLRPAPDQSATPPLDFKSVQQGDWNPEKNTTTFSKAEVTLTQKGDTLGSVHLDQPFTLQLGDKKDAGKSGTQDASQEARLTLDIKNIDVGDARPWLSIVDSHALDDVQKGSMSGKMIVRVVGEGAEIGAEGNLDLSSIVIKPKDAETARGPYSLKNKLSANVKDVRNVTITGTASTLFVENRELGSLNLKGDYDLEKGKTKLEAVIASGNIGDLLDKLGIVPSGQDYSVQNGSLQGNVGIERAGKDDELRVMGSTAVQRIVILSGKDKKFDRSFNADYNVALDGKFTQATVKNFALALADKENRALASVTAKGDYSFEKGKSRLDASISSANVSELLESLGMIGSEQDFSIQNGSLKGNVGIERGGKNDELRVIGSTSVQRILILSGKEKKFDRSFNADYDVAVDGPFTQATVHNFALALADQENHALASLTAKGNYSFEKGKSRLDASFASANVSGLLESMGVTQAGQSLSVRNGALKGNAVIERAGNDDELRVKGSTAIQKMTFVSNKDRKLDRSVKTDYEIAVDGPFTMATVKDFTLALADSEGASAGEVKVAGNWPLKYAESEKAAAKGKGGEAKVSVTGLRAGPWMKLFSVDQANEFGEAPADAEINLTVDSTGKNLTLDGSQKIGPIRFTPQGLPPENISIAVANRLTKVGDDIQKFSMEMTAKRSAGPSDQIRAEGSGKLGKRPSIKADIKIASISPEIYTAQFSSPAPGASGQPANKSGKPATAAPPSPAQPAPPASSEPKEWPADMDVNVVIEKLVWRQIQSAGMQAKITSDPKTLKALIEKMNLNGGDMNGHAEVAYAGADTNYTWEMKGKGIETAAIVASFQPSLAQKIEGKAEFDTKGTGVQKFGASTPDLNGALQFDLTNGRIKNAKLLDFIGKVTGTDYFEQVVFDGFHGEVDLKEKWANLKNTAVSGKATRLLIEGKVGLEGDIDLTVQPGLGPELSKKIPAGGSVGKFAGALLGNVDGFSVFPLAVTVTGKSADPRYGVRPKLPPGVGNIEEAVKNTLMGVVGGVVQGGTNPTDALDGIKNSLGDRLGGILKDKSKTGAMNAEEKKTGGPAENPNAPAAPQTEEKKEEKNPVKSVKDGITGAVGGIFKKDKKESDNTAKDKKKAIDSAKDLVKPEEAPKDSKMPEEAPKDSKMPEEAPKDSKMPDDAPKESKKPDDAPKDLKKSADAPKDSKKPDDAPKDSKKSDDAPKESKKPDDAPKDSKKPEDAPKDSTKGKDSDKSKKKTDEPSKDSKKSKEGSKKEKEKAKEKPSDPPKEPEKPADPPKETEKPAEPPKEAEKPVEPPTEAKPQEESPKG